MIANLSGLWILVVTIGGVLLLAACALIAIVLASLPEDDDA